MLRHPRTTHNDNAVLMQGLAELWTRGVKVDWAAFHLHETRNRLSLRPMLFSGATIGRRQFRLRRPRL